MRLRTSFLAFLLLATTPLLAENVRVVGTVVDDQGDPLEDVRVSIRSEENNIERKGETNKKGRFAVSLPDGTLTWVLHLEAEGRLPLEETLRGFNNGILKKTWQLSKGQPTPEIPPEVALTFNEGADAYRQGDRKTARERFEKALEMKPGLAPALEALGPIYLADGDFQKAVDVSKALLEVEKDDTVALKVLHDATQKLGDEQASLAALDRLVKLERSPEVTARVFNHGAAALRSQDLPQASKFFHHALELEPGHPQACGALGNILLSQNSFTEALETMDACLAIHPKNASALTTRFNALRALGREEEADAAFGQLQESDPKAAAEVTFRQGELLFEMNNTAEALASFMRTLSAEPDHAGAHYMIGLTFVNLGRNTEAREHLSRYLELEPEGEHVASVREILGYLE